MKHIESLRIRNEKIESDKLIQSEHCISRTSKKTMHFKENDRRDIGRGERKRRRNRFHLCILNRNQMQYHLVWSAQLLVELSAMAHCQCWCCSLPLFHFFWLFIVFVFISIYFQLCFNFYMK